MLYILENLAKSLTRGQIEYIDCSPQLLDRHEDKKNIRNKLAWLGTAVTNPACILKMYVSWCNKTFPVTV